LTIACDLDAFDGLKVNSSKPFALDLTAERRSDLRSKSSWGRRRRIEGSFRATRRSLALLGTVRCTGLPQRFAPRN